MTGNASTSLFNGMNLFRRTSQTWTATKETDTCRLSPSVCRFESLESRVLMSVAHPLTHSVTLVANSPPTVSAKPKAQTLVAPAAPTSLSATPLTFNSVQLNWTAGSGMVTGYIILRGTDGVHFTQLAKLTTPVTTYTDRTVASFHTYYYEVEAYNVTVPSPASASATASTSLAVPATFSAIAAGPTSIKLTWAINEPLATGYNVLRSTDGAHFSQYVQLPGLKLGAYTDTVSSNTTYSYEVQAYNGNKVSAVSSAIRVTTPLIAPTALTASYQSSAIHLAWTGNDSAAAGYLIFRAGADGKTFTQIASLSGNGTTSYSDTAILSGHGYTYKVEAYAGSNTSAATAAATASTPLAAPSALTATVTAPTTIHLAWTDNDVNALGYNILRSTDGVHFTQIAKLTGASVATYIDAAAASGTAYTYQVCAYAGTITSNPATSGAVATPLAAPATLSATAASPTSVKLTWSISDPQAGGYDVLRSSNGVDFSQIIALPGKSSNTYTDTVSSATAYTYEVQAYNGGGNSSAVSKTAAVTTPLIAPSSLGATIVDGTVHLSWADNDSAAAGYYVLRSINAKPFTQIANLNNATVAAYTDSGVLSGHAYSYEIQAYNGANTSAASIAAPINMPLAAPSGLTVTSDTAANVQLAWTDNDVNAAGYYILRSTDGVHFTELAALTSATASTYTDARVTAGASYTYEVEACAGSITSAASNTVNPTVPLTTPTGVTATLAGAYVNLAWTDADPAAAGFNILRSTDGGTFTQLVQLTSASVKSYADLTVTAGHTYSYQVQAYNGSLSSAISSPASVTTPSGSGAEGVAITTRFGDELVITAAGTSDSVAITESGTTLTIAADGQTFTDTAPAGGTFVYTRGGHDSINVDSSVTSPLTIDSIDAAITVIDSNAASVNAWVDSTDSVIGTATVHSVASFAGGVSKALGASLANPKDAGATAKVNLSLFGTGPVAADVNQGEIGDCYFLSSLAAFANQNPRVLVNSAVDLGDGTYAVQFYSNGQPVYVRVNNSFTVGGFGGYYYAHPGANNDIWAPVIEKAFAYFRSGANSYASISSGWMDEVYTDLGVQSASFNPASFSDNDLFSRLSTELSDGEAVTLGTQNAPNLVHSHAYTLLSVYNSGGTNYYVVRNPWGSPGDSLENSQGIATLTYAQMIANFVGGVAAMN